MKNIYTTIPKYIVIVLIVIISTTKANSQNQNISNGSVFEGEPYIVVNPKNTKNIVVAWMGFVFGNTGRLSIKTKASFNGGYTWIKTNIMPHVVASTYKSADPSMVFDKNGNLFLSYIDYRESPDSGGVYLCKSTNGGISWGTPVKMIDVDADPGKSALDRPFIAINEDGDKLYLTTKPAPWIAAPNRPYYTCSTDSGKTWNQWRYVDSTGYLVGNMIQAPMAAPAASGNNFYAAYPSYVTAQNIYPQYILASTNNNGASFTYNKILNGNTGNTNDSAKLAYKLLVNPNDSNHLVFIYPYSPFGDIDVMMTETKNAGNTWSTPVRINDDAQSNGKMQDLIWGDFDTDGGLVISWRDKRNAAGSGYATASEFYAAYRNKDSTNFAANFKLSDSLVAYNNILSQNGNDFMGIALDNDTISAVWGNTRDGSLDIWFTRTSVSAGKTTSVSLIESESADFMVYPNPSANGIYNIQLRDNQIPLGSIIQEINIYNSRGENVFNDKSKSQKIQVDLSMLSPGIYFVTIISKNKILKAKIIR